MVAAGATGAYVVTSGVFTKEAQRFSEGRNITLVDGEALKGLIGQAQASEKPQARSERAIARASNVHDRQESTLAGAESTPECPSCNGPMVKRVARRGSYAGKTVWGCADYPKCRGTREL